MSTVKIETCVNRKPMVMVLYRPNTIVHFCNDTGYLNNCFIFRWLQKNIPDDNGRHVAFHGRSVRLRSIVARIWNYGFREIRSRQ